MSGRGKRKTRQLAFDLGDVAEIGVQDHLQILRQVLEFLVGHGHGAPVLRPRRVIHLLDAPDLAIIVPHVHLADREAIFPLRDGHPAFKALRSPAKRTLDMRQQVHHRTEPKPRDQLLVIRRVVRHHDHRRVVESIDEEADVVVDAHVHRAAHDLHAAGLEKTGRRTKQRRGHCVVLHAFEETEETGLVPVSGVVVAVDDAGDPPAARAALIHRQK